MSTRDFRNFFTSLQAVLDETPILLELVFSNTKILFDFGDCGVWALDRGNITDKPEPKFNYNCRLTVIDPKTFYNYLYGNEEPDKFLNSFKMEGKAHWDLRFIFTLNHKHCISHLLYYRRFLNWTAPGSFPQSH